MDYLNEETGIYRGEVVTIVVALADITVKVDRLLSYFEGDDDEEEAEEDLDS